MPFPNEHAARLKDPKEFDKDSFKRTAGGTLFARIKIPKSIGIIWGKLKGGDESKKPPVAQSLRFDKTKWSIAKAKTFLKDNSIKPIKFEPASKKSTVQDEDMDMDEFDDDNHDELDINSVTMKYKTVLFDVKECYSEKSDAGNFGYIEGYASTYEKDRSGDVIMPGAFKKTIKRHKKSGRPIRMYFQHNGLDVIGGFPINKAKEDDKGLFVVGQINLDVQKGAETYALAKQGVLSDLSIGYSVTNWDYDKMSGTTYLKEVELWEISVVSEPMNMSANILSVKEKSIEEFDCMKDVENFLKNPESLTGSQRKVFISKLKQFSNQRDVDDVEDDENVRDADDLSQKLDEVIIIQKLTKCEQLFNIEDKT